jgi:hypothetical protein
MYKFKYIIVDIDGTIASHDKIRGHHEYDKVSLDKPIEQTIEVIKLLYLNPLYRIVYLTGRPDKCKEDTMQWLYNHIYNGRNVELSLYMRTTKDFRDDSIIKKELLYEFMNDCEATKDDIYCVFDDRIKVINMWLDEGLFVFNMNNGKGEF